MQLEIEKTLVVSTAHLTKEEADILWNSENYIVVSTEYYVIIDIALFTWLVVSDHLQAIQALAKENGCQYVKFDRDGNTLDGYKTFDW